MELTEDLAGYILALMSYKLFEEDEDEDDRRFRNQIEEAFPKFREDRLMKEHHDHLWSVVVEQDKRVIEAREKVNLVEKANPYDHDEIYKRIHDMFTIKRIVLKELLAKEKSGG